MTQGSLVIQSYLEISQFMALVKVFHDRIGNTLVVWFGNPEDEYEVEKTGNEVVLMKDKNGKVIGLEKLNFVPNQRNRQELLLKHLLCS